MSPMLIFVVMMIAAIAMAMITLASYGDKFATPAMIGVPLAFVVLIVLLPCRVELMLTVIAYLILYPICFAYAKSLGDDTSERDGNGSENE